MKRTFASRLLKSRFLTPQELHRVWQTPTLKHAASNWRSRRIGPTHVKKGVINGQFVRFKLPDRPPRPRRMPKLPSPATTPVKPFTQPPGPKADVPTMQEFRQATSSERKEFFQDYWDRLKAWTKHNFAVIVLNFGSVCSLIGFTRSDVLELRLLSVSGTLSYIVYFMALPPPRDWTPILWSLTFLAVNGQKIYQILVERKGSVKLSEEQQHMYDTYFKAHGITRQQFQYIMEKAQTIRLKKGDILIREGEKLQQVYLVTAGKTRASSLGRRMTAVSFTPQARVAKGAWIGEMAFLERNWHQSDQSSTVSSETNASSHRMGQTDRAMYTIVALEDNTVVHLWSHADMQSLLDRSADMRGALTRAMTAAIVEKVVGFTNSKRQMTSSHWYSYLWPWASRDEESPSSSLSQEEEEEHPKVIVGQKPVFGMSNASTA